MGSSRINVPTCVCLGPTGGGKSLLLRKLLMPDVLYGPVPTVGSNLVTIKANAKDRKDVCIRELGGSMVPIWNSFLSPQISHVMIVLDSSDPARIAANVIQLCEILTNPKLQYAKVLICLNKVDMTSAVMSIKEFRYLVRLDDILRNASQDVTVLETSGRSGKGREQILDWLMGSSPAKK